MSNADGSLLLATHPVIASEFNDLPDSSWLITSFVLASAATQTLVRCFQLVASTRDTPTLFAVVSGLRPRLTGMHSMEN